MIDTEKKIMELLSKYRPNDNSFNSKTTLQSMHMVSEDMSDFLNDYFKEFNIDNTGFNYYDYFMEDVNPLHVIRDFYYRFFYPEKIKRTVLTIGHLIKVAKKGTWLPPK